MRKSGAINNDTAHEFRVAKNRRNGWNFLEGHPSFICRSTRTKRKEKKPAKLRIGTTETFKNNSMVLKRSPHERLERTRFNL